MDAQDEGGSTDRSMPVGSTLVPQVTADETTKNANYGQEGKMNNDRLEIIRRRIKIQDVTEDAALFFEKKP